ncbi:LytR/AlgR family response regulator transcription factor [Shewanella woodyi]|uniref:Two component transcriptional regulator, LytTR family n=1 Tax=Shewanella woodyi (strain ATCC 51908 / MS32) TaxID=392500 RepID=B1KPY2_SHEWM|nr:LytTR family DNA-binding domain-containing protein [Shewanella woodyi]ACA89095.1 two component transcriptional regulator, LytTR family [Shewanella woodyi ATCC 51908]
MLKVLIVDDEYLARLELTRLLSKYVDIEIVGEAEDGHQALELLKKTSVDLAFVDIQMPEMDGLEFAKQAESQQFQLVFCTAFSEHAVDAFELNAFDYIVKPIMPERLEAVLNKVRLIQETHDETEQDDIQCLPDNHGLLLKFGSDYKIVRINEICRFESLGNHVAVYSDSGKSYLHISLSKVEKKLDPAVFFKASRSDIVRVDQIDKIEEGMASGSLQVHMNNGQEIDVSRRQVQLLRKIFSIDSF